MKTNALLTHSGRLRNLFFAACLGAASLPFDRAAAQAAPTSVGDLRAKNPYRFVGLLTFTSDDDVYIGSATVIKPYSLLTAGHNLYSEADGWSTDVIFERSYDFGTRASRVRASGLFVLGGYASLADAGRGETSSGFARDMGGAVCFSRPAKGLYAAWKKGAKLLTGTSYNMSLGYGAEVHSGEELLRSAPTRTYYKVKGGFYENRSYGIEAGMSGGPVFAKKGDSWYVCAVNVSGPGGFIFNRGAGVRAIDDDSATLIDKQLK